MMDALAVLERVRRMDVAELGAFAEKVWASVFTLAGVEASPLEGAVTAATTRQGAASTLWLEDRSRPGGPPTVYVTVRGKRHPVLWRKDAQRRHGMALADWMSLDRVRDGDRHLCYVGVFEAFADEANCEWSGAFLLQTMAKLGTPYKGFGPMADTAFWPRDRFAALGGCPPLALTDLWRGRAMPDDFKPALVGLVEMGAADAAQKSLF